MAKQSEQPRPYLTTKKHMAREDKERRQRTIILAGVIIVIVAVIALITIPFFIQYVIQPGQPVAIVNDEKISTGDWQTQTSYYRYNIIRRIENTLQLASLFGSDPNSLASITSQLQPLLAQLEPLTAGQSTLDFMVDDTLIRQEANSRGITITEEKFEQELEQAFGYFADGTPTPTATFEPISTPTLSSIQQTLVPSTETAVVEEDQPTVSPTEISTPTTQPTAAPSPTPFTYEGYQDYYKETLAQISDIYGISTSDMVQGLRYDIASQFYREELIDDMFGDMSCSESQVWARHILVDDEQTAVEIKDRLDDGENFCSLAAEFSTDTSNKDNCGDLNWFGESVMVNEFEEAAFALKIGDISSPIETQFGYHIIQSLGNEERTLTETDCSQKKQQAFNEWLTETRANATIEIMDYWVDRVPEEPTLPIQTQLAIQQLIQQSSVPGTQP